MKLAISNIAWSREKDEQIYKLMRLHGFTGLEIAPTSLIEKPYDCVDFFSRWKNSIGFDIPSIQSIWYGKNDKIFNSSFEMQTMVDYTKKAILFAEKIGCKNLVLGCPKNRVIPENFDIEEAVIFFRCIGNYAFSHSTIIALEANPVIYGTNFINCTEEAIKMIYRVNSKGFLLNLDIGTIIENNEKITYLKNYIPLINHVHVSEPGLEIIKKRQLHKTIANILSEAGYDKYISIEMKRQNDIKEINNVMKYVGEIFYDL